MLLGTFCKCLQPSSFSSTQLITSLMQINKADEPQINCGLYESTKPQCEEDDPFMLSAYVYSEKVGRFPVNVHGRWRRRGSTSNVIHLHFIHKRLFSILPKKGSLGKKKINHFTFGKIKVW
uniref:Uncharacterized protein n=1 Tax=Salarias fasciatus TaxID=181472 RepID=A0A672J9Q2_SALFA